jgi:hypothetical protein
MSNAAPGGLAFANTSVTIARAAPPWRVERVGCTLHLGSRPEGPERAPA